MIDLAAAITKKDANHAAQEVGYVKERHPEVTQILGDFKFHGQRQKKTILTDLRGVVELTLLLPGRHAGRVRRQAADPKCRYWMEIWRLWAKSTGFVASKKHKLTIRLEHSSIILRLDVHPDPSKQCPTRLML